MIEGILWVVQTRAPAFVDNFPSPQFLLDLGQEMILFLFDVAKTHGPSHRFLVMSWPWDHLHLGVAEQISANQLRRLSGCKRVSGSLGGQLEVCLRVTRFKPGLAGFDIGSEWKVVMFVVIFGFGEGLTLFCVLLQQLALQTGQIVHQYIYYNATLPTPNLQLQPQPFFHTFPYKPTPNLLLPSLNKYQLINSQFSNR